MIWEWNGLMHDVTNWRSNINSINIQNNSIFYFSIVWFSSCLLPWKVLWCLCGTSLFITNRIISILKLKQQRFSNFLKTCILTIPLLSTTALKSGETRPTETRTQKRHREIQEHWNCGRSSTKHSHAMYEKKAHRRSYRIVFIGISDRKLCLL